MTEQRSIAPQLGVAARKMTGQHQQYHHDSCLALTTTQTTSKRDACNDDDTSSIDSQQEALCELLGLPLSYTLTIQEDNDDDGRVDGGHDDDDEACTVSSMSKDDNNGGDEEEEPAVTTSWIDLPPNASRYFHPPSQCTAFCIPELFTLQECQVWIDLAAAAPSNQKQHQQEQQQRGFQYITHAKHTSPDGATSFLVKLQNPNPHKLSVFSHSPSVDLIWKRLKRILLSNSTCRLSSPIQKLLDREGCGEPVGVNPRLRVLKYDAMDRDEFQPHFDATTRIGPNQISLLTVLIYLNTGGSVDFAGGDTLFLNHVLDPSSSAGASSCINTRSDSTTSSGVVAVTPTAGSAAIFEHDLYHSSTPLEWGTKYVLRTDIVFHLEQDPQEKQFQKQQQQQQYQQQESTDAAAGTTATFDSSTCSSIATTPYAARTCCNTMAQLCEKLQVSAVDREALDELGMLGLSLEAFCSTGGPGKFALYQILQSVGISTPTCRALIEEAFAERKSAPCLNNGTHKTADL